MNDEFILNYTGEELNEKLEMVGYLSADAKAVKDRLGAIECQTVTTDVAYKHKELPEGEKVVSVCGDGIFGTNAYACTNKDLIPRKTFTQNHLQYGVTLAKTSNGYHIEGTNTHTSSLSIYFGQTASDVKIELDEALTGKTLKLLTFASDIIGEGLGLVVEFKDSSDTQLSRKSMYFAKTNAYNSSTTVVPEGTSYMRVSLSISAGKTLNHDIQAYVVVDEDTQAIDLNSSLTAEVDTTVTELFTFPYQSTVSTKLSLVDYIGYTADNSEAVTSLSYLTPEDFGAIGDGYADDSVPISLCLATAATTKQTVLMAKKYYISNPIDISQNGLQIIINDIEYDGDDTAVKIHGIQNSIKIHSIKSSAVGISFLGDGARNTTHNDLEVNIITSSSHGIEFLTEPVSIYQNVVKFNYIKAGGIGCYGIAFHITDNTFATENHFYGGQIENCDWAVYNAGGNSKFYNIQVEGDVQGGFYIRSGCVIFYPRCAEAQRDGSLPFYKFMSTYGVHIYDPSGIALNEIDLSECEDDFKLSNGESVRPLHEGRVSTIEGRIMTRLPETGVNGNVPNTYCMKAYVWGRRLIMQPFMAYRKVVTTETLDTRLIGRTEETDAEIMSLAQLPTKYVVNAVNSEIYLHSSYCAFGFNEFEVEQANGFTCKVYDVLGNLIFDGTDNGDGVYKLNVYKDAEYCIDNSAGLLRRDFLGHYWQIVKEGITVTDDGAGNVTLTTEVISV
jgi:hypothetical protein